MRGLVMGLSVLAALAASPALAAAPALAEDAGAGARPFCADRPGAGTPPCVLDVGRWQVELGVSGSWDKSGGVETRAWSFADLELRFGVTPTMEAQLYWTPWATVRERAGGVVSRASGSGDLTLAVRKSLRNPDGEGLSLAVQPVARAPTGSDGIGAGQWQGGMVVPVSAPLPGGLSLGFSPEIDINADADGSGHHLGYGAAIGVAGSVGEIGWGAELWAGADEDPSGRTTGALVSLSAAWTPAALPDTQFDVGADFGLNHETPGLTVGAGAARRF
ncbi:MAG: transporter [Caulobacteraceae bacterium]